MSKIHLGSAWPLGSSITKKGVNFSVASPLASSIELLIFQNENDKQPREVIAMDNSHKSGDYWHVEVEGLTKGCHYCYRVLENSKREQTKFFHQKALLDPCSREISGWNVFKRDSASGTGGNIHNCLKSVVSERQDFDFYSHPRPKHPWNKTIIYELHVGGFTKQIKSGISDNKKGTFLGLIEKIPYLKDLGVTTIELLPIFAFDYSDAPKGLNNYWGYSPINWFTPHHQYIARNKHLRARDQFRSFVAACHDNDLEVILDVVYNHTTEGNEQGPIISWKGFGQSTYYHQNKEGKFLDVTGCGNTIAANNPLTRQLIIESMKCWATELGVDGFRFDLGITLSRGENLTPLESPPIFEDIESDPQLSGLKLISEPWDCGGLYKIADFPAKNIRTWNGHFRDDMRRFWNAEKNSTWPLKDRLMGSPEIYKDNINSSTKSINFISSHDGFTLLDLVSFKQKHNLSNGENNRDGENTNNSWNYGVEGPCTNKEIVKSRSKHQRNLITSLLLSPGIPMISMGDEVGRSQGGNNNAWCQDNPIGWMIWDENHCDNELRDFVKKIITIRKKLPLFFSPVRNPITSPISDQQDLWIEWHGVKVNSPDWSSWSNTIAYSVNDPKEGAILWVGLNAYKQAMKFQIPVSRNPWIKLIDTSYTSQKGQPLKALDDKCAVYVESKSIVVISSKQYLQHLSKRK